ncbi:class I SAM-dependent methyltransferase [Mobilicoccus caccae]|nr:class I SAM-dependent methyltransferase [Mobilicoccus caccae]
MDRALAHVGAGLLRRPGPAPLVVDLGYGAAGTTTLELWRRLTRIRADVEVVGVEIDPARVAAARPLARPGLRFVRGGFDLAGLDRAPILIRAANVLRQYDEGEVKPAWELMSSRLAPDGLILEGTCDEIGRRSTWVWLGADGPVSLTVSLGFTAIERPSDVAERLPKALIHRNVPGEPVHAFLQALDSAWDRQAPLASYGRRQRFVATCAQLRQDGWPLIHGPRRWRLGEITVDWRAVAPQT